MEKNELLRTLQALHEELSQADQIDPDAEKLLRTVTTDIQRLLAEDPQAAPPADAPPLSSKLHGMVLEWEADHPRIARTIGQIADALANLGI